MWWYTLVIPALGRLRQADCHEYENQPALYSETVPQNKQKNYNVAFFGSLAKEPNRGHWERNAEAGENWEGGVILLIVVLHWHCPFRIPWRAFKSQCPI